MAAHIEILSFALLLFIVKGQKEAQPKIGIIGGGLAGTSSAYFLHQAFGKAAKIDIYEPEELCGRVATIIIGGREFESGGTIIHPRNEYMQQFAETFGLKHKDNGPEIMGLYGKSGFAYKESQWSIWNYLSLLFRYGLGLFSFTHEVDTAIDKFNNIYQLQNESKAYTTIEKLVKAMGGSEFVKLTQKTLYDSLKEHGISEKLTAEFASVATRVNYGQSLNMTAFPGWISLAGIQPGLWAIYGGNKLICSHLLKASEALHLKSIVTEIHFNQLSDQFEVTSKGKDANGNWISLAKENYNMMVVATPLHLRKSNIAFTGFSHPIHNLPGSYHRTVATFILGTLNSSLFCPSHPETCPSSILTFEDTDLNVTSVSVIYPVDYQQTRKVEPTVGTTQAYKIFSNDVLNEKQLDRLFVDRKEVKVVDWLAYPDYKLPHGFADFVLSDNLYYINGFEWVASAMETALVGAKNVALLAYNNWFGDLHNIDDLYGQTYGKSEL